MTFGERFQRLQDFWLIGFALLLIVGLTVIFYGLGALLVILVLTAVFGHGGVPVEEWLLLSSLLWAPAAIGSMGETLKRNMPKPPLFESPELTDGSRS